MNIEINAEIRTQQGKNANRRLRRSGRVPAILYGRKNKPQLIDLDHKETYLNLNKESFFSSILNITIDGKKEMCLLRAVHRHPFKPEILHVDFQRVTKGKAIRQRVPLHFINADIAPGVKMSNGLAHHVLNDIEVECLPKDLPAFIEVDLKNLEIGHSIHLSEIQLPKGVEVISGKEDEDLVLASIVAKSEEKEPIDGAEDTDAPASDTSEEA